MVCAVCVQGGSVAMSQSAETGSSTAMMDVDSMTSQVRTPHTMCMYTGWLLTLTLVSRLAYTRELRVL